MIHVKVSSEPGPWDQYVESKPLASNYHRWKWRETIEDTFGHRPYYLAAYEDGRISGVLPLVCVRSNLFGDSLVSMPFASYGGVLSDTVEASECLLNEAVTLARRLHAERIELRQASPLQTAWQASGAKVTMSVPLPSAVNEFWKGLSSNLRHNINRGRKRGLAIAWEGADALPEFYQTFAENMRNLGTPVYPLSWFQNIFAQHEVRLLIIRDEGKCVASGFVIPYKRILELPWSASTLESRKKYAHVLLFWTVMEWAIENGFETVDLGRCTQGGGTYEFKRHWPCVEEQLYWYYWLPAGKALAELRPENPRYAMAIRAWKHLPLGIANFLGPRIVRGIP